MEVSGACAQACMSVSVCVSVWEALDIKVNFNKVWRLAGGIGETCQAQTLSLCVPSHPVFTSSGQLAAFSVCWTSWQSHIFHYEFYMNINNPKSLEYMTVTVKLMLTVYGKCYNINPKLLWNRVETMRWCHGDSKVRDILVRKPRVTKFHNILALTSNEQE